MKASLAGMSLIETLVVIGIIAILSLFSLNTINNFRKSALLENTVTEFISMLREARSKSMNGEFLPGETVAVFAETGLPEYGLSISGNSYQLVRQCLYADGRNCADDLPLTTVTIGVEYLISPEGSLYFKRIGGDTPGKVVTIRETTGKSGRQIDITPHFVINVTAI